MAEVAGSTDVLSGITTGRTTVDVLTTSLAFGPVGFLTRPVAVMFHWYFQLAVAGAGSRVPDQVAELVPDAVALATAVPVAYVPALPPVQPVKLVAVMPVHVT